MNATTTSMAQRTPWLNWILLLIINIGMMGWINGQTNPAAHNLSSSDFSFTGFALAATTTYPTSMQGHKFPGERTTANLTVNADGDRVLADNTTGIGTGSIRNEVANGISLLNSSSNNIGAILISVNSTGRNNLTVSWTAQQLNSGGNGVTDRINGLRLQYRIGTTGSFTDVSLTEYLTTNTSSQNAAQSFTSIALPSACNNEAVVHVRWVYYISSGTANARDRIRLDDITIASSPASGPSLTFTPSSLTTFSATVPLAGSPLTTTITGSSLTPASGSITVSAPTNFEVSKDGVSWGPTATFDYTSGNSFNVANSTVRFRIAAGAPFGAVSGSATSAGGGVGSPPSVSLSGNVSSTLYWNGGNIAANPADGGTGSWGTVNAWRQPSPTGNQATWLDNNPAIAAGTPGILTIEANRAVTSLDFQTSGYTLTPDGTTGRTITGPTTVSATGALNINSLTAIDNRTISFAGNVSGVAGASIVMNVNQTGTNTSRINLASPGATLSLPVTVAVGTTSSGFGNFAIVGTSTGTVLTSAATIINNTPYITTLGATSGNDLTVNSVISGSSPLMIAAGSSGGAGTVVLNGVNTYTGNTIFNATGSTTGTLRLGNANALPSATNVSYGAGQGIIWDLNSFNSTIASLTSGVGSNGSITNANAGSGTSTLTINGATSTTFGLPITNGATAFVALTRAGSGSTTLSGNNTYTGATTVTSGTLYLNGTNASNITVAAAGEIGGNGTTTGTLNLSGNVSPGATGVGSIGTFTTAGQTWNTGATYNFDISNVAVSALNQDRIVSTGAVALSGTIFIDVVGAAAGFVDGSSYTWPLITGTSVTGSPTYSIAALGFVPAFTGAFSVTQTATAVNLVYTPVGGSPTLSPSTTTITGLNYIAGAGPSAWQSFTFTGADLTPAAATITITGSANFQVSSNGSTPAVGNTFDVTAFGGTVASTTVWVRLIIGLSANTYTSATGVTIAGGGAPTVNISTTGVVTAPVTPFTAGNIVVARMGTDPQAVALTSAANPIFLVEYTPTGTPGITVPLPTTTSGSINRITGSGTATSEGQLNLSVNGQYLTIGGYDAAIGTLSVNSAAVPRVIARIDNTQNIETSLFTNATHGSGFRSTVTVDGTRYWTGGNGVGISSITHQGNTTPIAATTISTTNTNSRTVSIYNNQLYYSTGSATVGVYTVGTGIPTTGPQTGTINIATSGANPYAYSILRRGGSNLNSYVANETGAGFIGIQKYSSTDNGATWTYRGVVATAAIYGLTAEVNGSGTVDIYATTTTTLLKLTDATAFNATITGTPTVIATAPTNTFFRGVAFAPAKPRVNISASATTGFEALTTSITLTATSSAPVTGDQTVNVTVTGTGITGGDYTVPASITILNGQTTGTATFQISNDAAGPEGTETAIVTINTPSSGVVIGATNSVNISIIDDESNPSVSISASPTSGSETGATVVTLTATATSPVVGDQTVTVSVSGTGITAGDYTLSSTTITILDGQTVGTGTTTFTIVDDAASEGTETAVLTLTSPSFGVEVGSPSFVNISITDNEPSIAVGNQAVTIVNTLDKPSQRNIIYQSSFIVTIANATLTGLTVQTAGTYQPSDLTGATFRLWYNVTSTNFYESIQLGSAVAPVASGGNVVFNGFSQLINSGQTARIWVTVDIAGAAVTGRTIFTAANPFTNFTFTTTGGLTGTNPVAASAVQTIVGNSPTFTGVIVPQFIQGIAGAGTNRIPYVYRATVAGLTPGATYRYFNQVSIASDAGNANGAGNAIFPAAGTYTRSTSVNVSTAPNYGEFTTDGTGSYTGWFITEPTANDRFIPGNVVNFRLCVNDGAGGTSVVNRITTALSATILNFGNTSGSGTQCTGLTGSTYGTEKNLVMLYDNINGTGRPISSAIIENDGAPVASYAAYYPNGVANAFGTIIPNNLTNGIRRVEERSLATGAIVDCPRVDADGIWPNAGSTASPAGGTTAIALNATDLAPIATPTFTTFNYINANSVSIGWVAVAGATSYIVDIATTSNFTSGFLIPINSDIGNVTSYTVGSLSPGFIYYYRVRATNSVCTSGYSDITPFLTSAIVWEGTVSTDWNTPQNWSPFLVPTASTDIEIFDRTNDPVIPTAGLNGLARNVSLNNSLGLASLAIQSGKSLNVRGNWNSSGNSVTGVGQVIFNGTVAQTITGATTFENLTFDKTSGTLTIASGIQSIRGIVRPTNGTLTTGDNLRLVSNASTTGIISGIGAGTFSGNVEVNRFMPGPIGYRYVSSPITQATGLTTADFDVALIGANGLVWDPLLSIPTPFPNCWYYDETQLNTYSQYGWTSATPGALVTGRGYALITPANHTASLVGPVNNGLVASTNPITRTGVQNGAGVNLLGNPYPSPISWNAFRTLNGTTEIAAVVKRFASTGSYYGQYVDWNGSVGTPGSVGDNIALGQAFFITKTNAGSLPINYTNAIRVDNSSTTFYETQPEVNNLLRMQLVGGAGADELVVYFDPTATNNYDVNYDAIKFLSETAGIPNIYTNIDTLKVSINVLEVFNQDMVIPMGIVAKTAGNYQVNVVDMSTFAPSATVYLEDRNLGTFTNLRAVNQYNVNLPVGEHNGRFFIHFHPAVEVAVTNETCQQTDGTVTVTNPSTEQQWNVSLLDIAGQVVAQSTDANTAFTNLNDGGYTLKIVDASGYTVEQPISIEAGQVVEANIAPMNSNFFYTTDLIEASVAQVVTGMTYEWYLNGQLAGTGTEIALNVTEPGMYELMLKMSGATCIFQTSTSFSVTQETTVGIATEESASGFIIYPNPTRDMLNVQINQKIGFNKLSIFDASGRLVHTEILNGAQGQQTIQVNLNNLAAGLYQITLEGNQKRSTAKFSKTK